MAAAYGIALGVYQIKLYEPERLKRDFKEICDIMRKTRPTAVNLFWAIDRMERVFEKALSMTNDTEKVSDILIEEAERIYKEDIEINKAIGFQGRDLIKEGMNVLTHCNAGALATAGYGTALGVIRAAVEQGKKLSVYADETRPFLQGARLTVWELMMDNIDCKLICDNMSAYLMSKGAIDIVIVGADRIAANGDSANKIGTYSVAVLAKHHNIPMYFAAPTSTIDIACADGSKIPIEERSLDEVKIINGKYICPEDSKAINPSFDVTPSSLITGIITEKGVIYPPYEKGIRSLF